MSHFNPSALFATQVAGIIKGPRAYDCTDEYRLQDGIAQALTDAGLGFEREAILTPRDRIDFLLGAVGVEVKVDGSPSDVARQVLRYLALPQIASLVLVTTRARLGRELPAEVVIGSIAKPIVVVELWRNLL